MKQKLHHESEGSTSYRFIRLKVLLFVFSNSRGLTQKNGLCVGPPPVWRRPASAESRPKRSVQGPTESWRKPGKRIAHHCCRDLGTAGDVVVVLFRVQCDRQSSTLHKPVTVKDGLERVSLCRSFFCPANETGGQGGLQLRGMSWRSTSMANQ